MTSSRRSEAKSHLQQYFFRDLSLWWPAYCGATERSDSLPGSPFKKRLPVRSHSHPAAAVRYCFTNHVLRWSLAVLLKWPSSFVSVSCSAQDYLLYYYYFGLPIVVSLATATASPVAGSWCASTSPGTDQNSETLERSRHSGWSSSRTPDKQVFRIDYNGTL